jgi:hypothetical protein
MHIYIRYIHTYIYIYMYNVYIVRMYVYIYMPACLGTSLAAQLRSARCRSHSCSASAKAFEEPVMVLGQPRHNGYSPFPKTSNTPENCDSALDLFILEPPFGRI